MSHETQRTTPGQPAGETARVASIQFGFSIDDIVTDHQYKGQRSTFHITYQYRNGLVGPTATKGSEVVKDDTYPFFQNVRNGIISDIRNYPRKKDFYEIFLGNLAEGTLADYPQLSWIRIKVDVPAYASVRTARFATVFAEQ
ncbi:hypothetical protein [Streptomyces sp. ADI96-02]|uniref:hypothetical protein n=1 Tax=Streptomyces sp. ADI96-02 TaxID=1522760 RepID=UPI000F55531D|nr:hypothetical protein [Streptomyces sp. ADI96-02]